MKFTLGWLRDHLDTKADLATIADTLTAVGLEVEELIDRAKALKGFVVARVETAERHPDADRLQLCTVSTGKQTFTVVCGAPNARAGMKGVLARPGTVIPATGEPLRAGKIRGVLSEGMLCSAAELELGEDHDGIIELSADAKVGTSAVAALGLNDPVIHLGLTPNRGDCLGVRGIARDLAAAGLGRLKPWRAKPVAGAFKSPVGLSLDFPKNARNACAHFVGRSLRGVKNGPSPAWLQRRLLAVGLRPISALVDVTNLMAIEFGRPMHVFDADRLQGNLTVRLARKGETLRALDGKDYRLDPNMCVIADEKEVLSLAGVIGGEASGCTEATTNVFVESAIFDPIRTAATGRKLNIETDARHRFERGVDPVMVLPGMEAATQRILQFCGGEAGKCVIVGKEEKRNQTVFFRPARVYALGGLNLPERKSLSILKKLGFESVKKGKRLAVRVPSWRNDIEDEADLVEEVLRIHGYDAIPSLPLPPETSLPPVSVTPANHQAEFARRTLAGRGMVEVVSWSFLSSRIAGDFGGGATLALENPISADLDMLRPSILPNLIGAAGRNADRGLPDLALFEIGPQYTGLAAKDQALVAAGLRTGKAHARHWLEPERAVDAFDAKADALATLVAAGVKAASLEAVSEGPAWYHPGRVGAFRQGPKNVLAHFGEVHPGILKRLDVEGPVVGFEVFLDRVPAPRLRADRARPPLDASPFQPIARDFAFVVDEAVAAGDILRATKKAAPQLIESVTVFDVYQGKGIAPGKKSLAISVTLQPREKTLTDEEITVVAEKIVENVRKATGAELRQ
ncbi:MAG: phenylalanine--tRNA ligase subunit beta [Alphaproteobacteria bacterium]|nr:phenylalanine--tRNA ligase subunit beta [Alphaproteobacteria bacterium]